MKLTNKERKRYWVEAAVGKARNDDEKRRDLDKALEQLWMQLSREAETSGA
jgi:hypothetical protein